MRLFFDGKCPRSENWFLFLLAGLASQTVKELKWISKLPGKQPFHQLYPNSNPVALQKFKMYFPMFFQVVQKKMKFHSCSILWDYPPTQDAIVTTRIIPSLVRSPYPPTPSQRGSAPRSLDVLGVWARCLGLFASAVSTWCLHRLGMCSVAPKIVLCGCFRLF